MAFSGGLLAQTPPDAGQILQEMKEPLAPLPENDENVQIETKAVEKEGLVGTSVLVQSLRFAGNTAFSDAELNAVLGPVKGSYHLQDLKALADKITSFYVQNGYPFARAYIPQSPVKKGVLEIQIVEGKYGEISTLGEQKLALRAKKFLYLLKPGNLIDAKTLERSTLILNDQPGIQGTPIMRPGKAFGTGNLEVMVAKDKPFSGEIGLDNTGNRYTGKYRGRMAWQANSPFFFGDQFSIKGMYTNEELWFGSVNYGFPIGSMGWRWNGGYAKTSYQLGEEFEDLDARGTANVASTGFSYPMWRSKQGNVTFLLNYQHKDLRDITESTNTESIKTSHSLPFGLQFDVRDSFGLNGITYGSVLWTYGHLDLDDPLALVDGPTAQTEGDFDKINWEIARLQAGPEGMMFYAHVSGQWARCNLDSSEGFGLGGVSGIRAYPEGEAYGDEGWLSQFELRYQVGAWVPYVFYDWGGVKFNKDPWTEGQNYRHLSGAGFGSRFSKKGWGFDMLAAWRAHGGAPVSDTRDLKPMIWASGKYQF